MSIAKTSGPVRHYAEDRLVDCGCDRRLGLPLLHHGRWSEVQFARCCGCGKVQAFVPVGDDPRELDRAGANRVVDIDERTARWLSQWPLLADHGSEPIGPFHLPTGTIIESAAELGQRIKAACRAEGELLPAERLRRVGYPANPAPNVMDADLQAALHAMDLVRSALQGELPADAAQLFAQLRDHDPRRYVLLEALVKHDDLDQLLDDLSMNGSDAPWEPVLLILHWSQGSAPRWRHYLEQLSAMPLTPVHGVDGLVHESFKLRGLLGDLVRSNAPREPLYACCDWLLGRATGLDDQLTGYLTSMLNQLVRTP